MAARGVVARVGLFCSFTSEDAIHLSARMAQGDGVTMYCEYDRLTAGPSPHIDGLTTFEARELWDTTLAELIPK